MIMISLLVPRGRHADDGGLGDEEEEDDEGGEAHEEPGESEAQSPVCRKSTRSFQDWVIKAIFLSKNYGNS